MLTFAANISTMFKEFDFIDRPAAATENGFKFIEIQSPYAVNATVLKEQIVEADIKVSLINSDAGEEEQFNCASIPGNETSFFTGLSKSLVYSFALRCPKIHIRSGYVDHRFSEEEQEECFVKNLISAAEVLEEHDILGLIEPISNEVLPNYFLNSFEKAVEILKKVKSKNIKLLLDVYHLHKIEGDTEKSLEKFYPHAGHIQVSQDPGRAEPFVPGGLINYDRVFSYLQMMKHQDAIGLEYYPSGSTKKSLEWLARYTTKT